MLIQLQSKLKQHQVKLNNNNQYTEAAVFIPLVKTAQGLSLLFQVRAATLSRQPGEICFPGGKIEPEDQTKAQAALRETQEELGLNADDLLLYSELDFIISPLGLVIYPACGEILNPHKIVPNSDEVAEVFTVPLQWFIDNPAQKSYISIATKPANDFPFDLIPLTNSDKWQIRGKNDVLFYHYQGRVIWGLTAQIIYSFLISADLIKQ